MALKTFTKTINLGTAGGSTVGKLKLIVTENSIDIANNTSSCTATLQLIIEPSGYSWRASSGSYSLSGNTSASGNIASMTYYKGTTTLVTKNFTKQHNEDGSGSISVGFSFSSSYVYNGSDTLTGTLTNIPRQANLLSAPDFYDESNFAITYENKAGNSVTSLQACIADVTGQTIYVPYRDISKTETSYTFYLTDVERNTLRNATPNSNELDVKFYIRTSIGGNYYYSSLTRKMTIINANPTFTTFDFEDTNPTTVALTGNNKYCVVGYSNIKATISTLNRAYAKKGATMSKYRFQIGSDVTDIAYSSSSSVNATINNVSGGTYNVYAIDSRNNTKLVTKLATQVKNYDKIWIDTQTTSITRNSNGIGTGAVLNLSGMYWNGDFGAVTNSIKTVTYKYKKTTSSTWINGTTSIIPTTSGANYTFNGLIAGDGNGGAWDVNDSYNIQITIADELSSFTTNLILNSGTPTMAMAKNGIAIKKKYDETIGGALQVSGDLDVDGVITVQGSSSPIYVGVKGDRGEPGQTGATGATGATGPTGPAGPANVLSIGTVTSGNQADAIITGTSPNQVLNLVLPKGDTGTTGEDGEDGFSPTITATKEGKVTTLTITDINGTSTATINDGEDGEAIIVNFDDTDETIISKLESGFDANNNMIKPIYLYRNEALSELEVTTRIPFLYKIDNWIFITNPARKIYYFSCLMADIEGWLFAIYTVSNNTVTKRYLYISPYLDIVNKFVGGQLSTLTTTDKSSLIGAINELDARLKVLEGNNN